MAVALPCLALFLPFPGHLRCWVRQGPSEASLSLNKPGSLPGTADLPPEVLGLVSMGAGEARPALGWAGVGTNWRTRRERSAADPVEVPRERLGDHAGAAGMQLCKWLGRLTQEEPRWSRKQAPNIPRAPGHGAARPPSPQPALGSPFVTHVLTAGRALRGWPGRLCAVPWHTGLVFLRREMENRPVLSLKTLDEGKCCTVTRGQQG